MFAKVALRGKISFGTCIRSRGQTSLIRPGLVWVEGAGTEEPAVEEEGYVSEGRKLS